MTSLWSSTFTVPGAILVNSAIVTPRHTASLSFLNSLDLSILFILSSDIQWRFRPKLARNFEILFPVVSSNFDRPSFALCLQSFNRGRGNLLVEERLYRKMSCQYETKKKEKKNLNLYALFFKVPLRVDCDVAYCRSIFQWRVKSFSLKGWEFWQ